MTAKQKVGWKVLRPDRGSVIILSHGSRLYEKRRKTIPRKGYGPLCVFTKRRSARNFAFSYNSVVKCLYKPSEEDSVWTYTANSQLLWQLPQDTALADSVTCLE